MITINKSIFLAAMMFMAQTVRAEVVEVVDDQSGLEDLLADDTQWRDHAPLTCKLKVTGEYNVRSSPSMKDDSNVCQTLLPGDNIEATGVSMHTDSGGHLWIQVTGIPDKYKCGNGASSYVNQYAFDRDDLAAFKNGQCGREAIDGGRHQPADNSTTDETATAGSRYHFPLAKCMGMKNDGGAGYYGAPRQGHTHAGADYYAPKGTQVYSPCDGKVTMSRQGTYSCRGGKTGGGAGNTITIRCNTGATFTFMHLNIRPQMASAGTVVKTGSPVGGVGNTGNAACQSPHLHTEYRPRGGSRANPESLWNCSWDSKH
jgi:hypothetical protein